MKQSSIKLYFLSFLALSLASCLKKGNMNIDTGKSAKNIIEFANTGDNVSGANSKYPRFTTDLGAMDPGETVDININVSYSGVDNAPEDITVTLAVDPDALVTYNTQNASNYVVPPASVYSFPATVVIKKGTRMAQVKLTVTRSNDFDFNVNYGLPLEIASASMGVISGNFGKAVYSFSARNEFDGIYLMEATAPMMDVVAPNLSGWYPIEMQLITFTGNSVALYDGINYVSAYGHPIKNGASGSYYGTFSPVFYFDATGKITDVGNYYGANAGTLLRSGEIDPNGVNQATFNPDGTIKSFEVSYILTQSGTPRTYFHEKFTYVEAR